MVTEAKTQAEKEEQSEPADVSEAGEDVNVIRKSPISQSVALLMCMALLGVALWTTGAYVHQQINTRPLRSGMKELSKLFEIEGESKVEIFRHAEDLVEELENISLLIEEVQKDILEVTQKIKDGWKQRFNFLFYFSTHLETWGGCKFLCENMNISMISIDSAEMEGFLVEELKNSSSNYWIALRTTGGDWSFIDGELPTTLYWKENADKDKEENAECAVLGLPCNHQVNCWEKKNCSRKYRCICKESAKEKWMK